jgi:hypothetical protein
VRALTSTEKGAVAESAITAHAIRHGIFVLRPLVEGRRYDLVFDVGGRLLRVQCKWGNVKGGVVLAHLGTCRHTPRDGYVRTTYSASEIDLFAIYAAGLEKVFAVPIGDVEGQHQVHLRLAPSRNNQAIGVKWAEQYTLGAVAQLEERRHGMAEARGSSPLSSTSEEAVHPGGLFVV